MARSPKSSQLQASPHPTCNLLFAIEKFNTRMVYPLVLSLRGPVSKRIIQQAASLQANGNTPLQHPGRYSLKFNMLVFVE
jgi:hypothetical protein